MKIIKQLLGEERGQAILQFTMVAMLLLFLFGGVIDAITIMRYQIAVSGAATEIANKITIDTANQSDINAIGEDVINANYQNILGDGETVFTSDPGVTTDDDILYSYHDYTYGTWSGVRKYIPVTIVLEREQVLYTPVGQMLFGNAEGRRLIRGVAQTRAYYN